MKIGLLLIGGSIKGLYGHTGTVAALRELQIKPDVILGASAGSVIGAFAATEMSTEEMYARIISLQAKDFLDPLSRLRLLYEFIFNKACNFTGFVKGDKVQKYVAKALKSYDDFSRVKIPLYVAATKLDNHKVVLFNTGKISEKVRASTAIPLLFCPKSIDNEVYVDGAITKELLPEVFSEVAPDLDLMIVSNLSHESNSAGQFVVDSPLPIFEIVRNVLGIRNKKSWPMKIGKTRIIYLKPGVREFVDIFKPDKAKAVSIFEEAKRYTIHHLSRSMKIIKKNTV